MGGGRELTPKGEVHEFTRRRQFPDGPMANILAHHVRQLAQERIDLLWQPLHDQPHTAVRLVANEPGHLIAARQPHGRLDARLVVPEAHRKRLQAGATLAVSVTLAVALATGAVVIGTLTALAMERYQFKAKALWDGLLYMPVIVPEIVAGVSLLLFFAATSIERGLVTLSVSHIAFSMPFVYLTVRARLARPAPDTGPDAATRPGLAREPAQPRLAAPSYPVLGVEGAEEIGLRSTFTHRGYLSAVARVREYILAGDIFQANLSQRFQVALAEPPLALYNRLRRVNPAAFGAYLDFGDLQVLSVSPERFLRLSGRRVVTRPIKGTRPRGMGPMHDALLGRVLAESDKDRAENVMIVDLLRNDLSRVCRPGTVRVPELFALEHHPTVHHLVSTVVGELDPAADAIDLLRAAFPGGSITGAPKVRAMEIIAELEPTTRGAYCGSLGYVGFDGSMDLSILIRTITAGRGWWQAPVGGGIVAQSVPEREYQETWDKAEGLLRAMQ